MRPMAILERNYGKRVTDMYLVCFHPTRDTFERIRVPALPAEIGPAHGKTGTSQNFRDAWFIGFAGNVVAGVWLGNDDGKAMRSIVGSGAPTAIWRDFMNRALR